MKNRQCSKTNCQEFPIFRLLDAELGTGIETCRNHFIEIMTIIKDVEGD